MRKDPVKGFYSNGGVVLNAFDREDGIAFNISLFSKRTNDKPLYRKVESYKFRIFRRKDNTVSFTFLKIRDGRIRTSDPLTSLNYLYTRRVKGEMKQGLLPRHKRKIKILLDAFCKRNKINTRYLSKDPLMRMRELCYPGSTEFNSIPNFKPNLFFKGNPSKICLKTNGKKSKNLLLEIVKKFPDRNKDVLSEINVIRKIFGLDKSQQYIELLLKGTAEFLPRHPNPEDINIARIKLYKQLTFDKVMKILSLRPYLIYDTIRMYSEHDIVIPENFQTGIELHDNFAIQCGKNRNRISNEIPKNKTIDEIVDSWDDEEYFLDIPEKTDTLYHWSAVMRNCVSSYSRQIVNKTYFIIGIKDSQELKFNVGFNVDRNTLSLQQWSGLGNSSIPTELQTRFAKQFSKVKNVRGFDGLLVR